MSPLFLLTLASSCLLFLQPHPSNADSFRSCHFEQIYNFGDSISDTGNLIRQKPIVAGATLAAVLPYGETFFKRPTGRWSNGRLMIDFIAKASGLPFLNPYLEKEADFRHGVNFAVSAATALPAKVLAKYNITDTLTNSSLHVQLDWMSKHLNSTRIKPKTSLFFVGEIADNDYNFANFDGKSQEIKVLVPQVVAAIMSGVRRVISSFGADRVIIPGLFPRGCSPIYLTIFPTNNASAYDEQGCLKEVNAIAYYHNIVLQEAIIELKTEYPDVIIVYGDYYSAFQWVFNHSVQFGFDGNSTRKSCCGIGGDYNFNVTRQCSPEVPVCPNPNKFIWWDGVHMTEAVYKKMAGWLIKDMLPKLKCWV